MYDWAWWRRRKESRVIVVVVITSHHPSHHFSSEAVECRCRRCCWMLRKKIKSVVDECCVNTANRAEKKTDMLKESTWLQLSVVVVRISKWYFAVDLIYFSLSLNLIRGVKGFSEVESEAILVIKSMSAFENLVLLLSNHRDQSSFLRPFAVISSPAPELVLPLFASHKEDIFTILCDGFFSAVGESCCFRRPPFTSSPPSPSPSSSSSSSIKSISKVADGRKTSQIHFVLTLLLLSTAVDRSSRKATRNRECDSPRNFWSTFKVLSWTKKRTWAIA